MREARIRIDMIFTDAQRQTITRLREQGWKPLTQGYDGTVTLCKKVDNRVQCSVSPDGGINGDA